MRVDGRAFRAIGQRLEGLRIADLGVDDVLPQVHAAASCAFAVRHPRRHLGRGSHVDAGRPERLLDLLLGRGNSRAGLPREEEDAEAERARIDPFALRRVGEMERVGGRPVERAGLHLAGPLHTHQRLAGDPGPERERGRAQALDAGEGAPRPHVEAEEGADHRPVARTDPRAPEDARVRLGDPRPIVAADAEHGGTARRAARPVDPRHLHRIDAQVIAEGRVSRLGGAQLVLLHHRKPPQVAQRAQGIGRDARLVPLAPVEGALLPGPAHLAAQLGEDQLLAGVRVRAFHFRQPFRGVRRRMIRRVVPRRPGAQIDAALARDPAQIQRHPFTPADARRRARGCG